MMGFFSLFTKSEKVVDTGLDLIRDVASGVDVSFLTDEERIQYGAKIMDQAIEFNAKIRDENSVRAKARRMLAKMFCYNYIIAIDLGIYLYAFRDKELGKEVITLITAAFGTIILCIVVSYYGYYGVMNVVNKKK
jgi:hypothetical protein